MDDEPNPWVRGQAVRVSRDVEDGDMEGLVAAVSDEWVVLERHHDYTLQGFTALRREDIDLVVVDDFLARALQAVGEAASDPGPLELHTTEDLIRSIAAHAPLITLHTEYDDTDVCWVGQVQGCEEGRVRLREISSRAEWHDDVSEWELDDVSRLDFSGRYERVLWLLGGPPPQGAN